MKTICCAALGLWLCACSSPSDGPAPAPADSSGGGDLSAAAADLGTPGDQSSGAGAITEYAPYFYTWGFGNRTAYRFGSLAELKAQSGLSAVTLAFVIGGSSAATGCSITTDGNTNAIETVMQADLAAYRKSGGRVKVSFGGAQGTMLESACSSATALATLIGDFISRTGLDDLDFDVEQPGVLTATLHQKRAQALAQVQARFPAAKVSFTLPALPRDKNGTPGGVPAGALDAVKAAAAAGVKLSHVNLMTMDYGPYFSTGVAMGTLAISAVNDARDQLKTIFPGMTDAQAYHMLGATPMIGQNDVSTEVFTLTDATTLATFARTQRLGLVSFWAIQRDQPCPYADLAVCSKVNSAPFQFHDVFKALP